MQYILNYEPNAYVHPSTVECTRIHAVSSGEKFRANEGDGCMQMNALTCAAGDDRGGNSKKIRISISNVKTSSRLFGSQTADIKDTCITYEL